MTPASGVTPQLASCKNITLTYHKVAVNLIVFFFMLCSGHFHLVAIPKNSKNKQTKTNNKSAFNLPIQYIIPIMYQANFDPNLKKTQSYKKNCSMCSYRG